MIGYLRTLRSKNPLFQARVADDDEEGFSTFCGRLAASLSDLTVAQRRRVGGALNEAMAPLRKILATFVTELAGCSPKYS